ncbi:sn-glycerol-3-phosphate import ATP-binding protein UgpC [Paralcaligenes ureilyticus]|uniref:Carbohydrate ABC transporter ATP-binding protein (CUT1 family) n=1 Tax=Paralcaligenes ureilyticus TaxID=627131 RepID=A0A4R3MB28_9BURK|nr:sn-glycerol-3-phosphate import ATP-binding protein UgpC [Paralcaligenes ureilyticus]TCT10342.1 carbohydrate ABC transporter ATP-binding protein (CUT1 family) [Paralcaligenes ureilyticus]
MATLSLRNVTKTYPGNVAVIHGINMDVADGEFIVIVGPSGCGKSTLMRMVAGLEDITGGEIAIDGKVVNELEPAERDIAMVFQNYALYPHMSVFQNMAYGLKIRKLTKADIERRVDRAAQILELAHLLDRRPRQLSGGQRQRVAMGRAIVREPKVFLFDEPLSNLDAKLRVQMRLEIQKLHRRLGTTSLYVTHDQVEAMTLAQRMVVMNKGIPEQIGTPIEVFEKPASIFVANFIGAPPMNLIPVQVDAERQLKSRNDMVLEIDPQAVPASLTGRNVIMGIRPEYMRLHARGIAVEVEMVEILGSEQLIHGRHGDTLLVLRCPVSLTAAHPITPGETVQMGADGTHPLHWFNAETGRRIED